MEEADATNEATPSTRKQKSRAARRKFLRQAFAATSGVVLARQWFFGSVLAKAAPQATPVCTPTSPAFAPVGELTSRDGTLKAVLSVTGGSRIVPGSSKELMLRYYAGYTPDNLTNPVWPTTTNAGPGPTLRCEVGDSVQITFLNRVDIRKFMGTGLYSAEGGAATDLCDEVNAGRFYPSNDKYPNCFHASSAANVHFHGTHVSPSTTGDNILVNVWPDPTMTDDDARKIQQWFQPIFDKGEAVADWKALPEPWRKYQMGPEPLKPSDRKGLVARYDDTAVYRGERGKLPENLRIWPANAKKIDDASWPQYYVGSYPFCFQIPKWNGSSLSMGQAPGTHWYHSHKHGSTTVNLFNGLAGALIIEDNSPTGYDGALKGYYTKQGQKLDQLVLVLQQITNTITMMVGSSASGALPGPPPVLINGQLTPTITMQPGQIQLWRCINATVQAFINAQFNPLRQKPLNAGSGTLKVNYRQTAQDGVQLAWENYSKDLNANPPFKLSPGNRIDVLVQAPSVPGCYVLYDAALGAILFINVVGTSASMKFPGTDATGKITIKSDYPPMPGFLADVTPNKTDRPSIVYGFRTDSTTLPADGNKNTLKQFTIDDRQFQDGHVDQTMKLNDAEEWKIENKDARITHPFHIHINPFQVVEIFDPNTMSTPLVLKAPYVWFDAFAIPAAKGTVPGYFKMRTRFVDFTGLYVQHCHILAHEDRGMMQVVQVCTDPNSEECRKQADVKHH
jgi:FtsP/CotA-like multicopper oxidase with cupredoxin domain